MAHPEVLLARARTAYERGRRRRALMISAGVLPMVLASFAGCGRPVASVALGALLAGLASALVWRGGIAARAVVPGLVAGVASLAFPLLVCNVLEAAGVGRGLSLLSCVVGGLASGLVLARYAAREATGRAEFVLVGGGVAALAGSLGCYAVGVGGVVAMALGLAATMPLAMRLAPR